MLCIYITKIYPFPRSVCKRLNIFFLELFTKNILRKRFISTHTQRLAHYDHIHPPQLKQDPKYPPSFQFTAFEFLCLAVHFFSFLGYMADRLSDHFTLYTNCTTTNRRSHQPARFSLARAG